MRESTWIRVEKPIGEPELKWTDKFYDIERVVSQDGTIIWFGQLTNWKKEPNKEWTVLTTNYEAKPLEKYLPEIVYGEDRTYFSPCDTPIYEKLYLKNKNI